MPQAGWCEAKGVDARVQFEGKEYFGLFCALSLAQIEGRSTLAVHIDQQAALLRTGFGDHLQPAPLKAEGEGASIGPRDEGCPTASF
jgi:hypothetical protein